MAGRIRTLVAVSVSALVLAAVSPVSAAVAAPTYVPDPAALVDPIIGTSGAVDDFPGANVPFGMAQFSPDTPSRPAGGGYEYSDSTVTGFSLTHISGPGCAASGDIPILPVSGAIGAKPNDATLPLDHAAETAQAGYYRLAASGITTELTATQRTGAARIAFPKGADANLILKLSDSAAGSSATRFQVVGPKEIQGSVTSGNFCGAKDSYTLHFDMVFDHAITAYGTYENSTVASGNASAETQRNLAPRVPTAGKQQAKSETGARQTTPNVTGTTPQSLQATAPPVVGSDGAYVSFDTATNATVQANVGLSYTSNANAKKNRTAENKAFAFDTVQQKAHDAWTAMLSKIQIGGGPAESQKTFYTALYHALLHPNVFSDVNGRYAGFDGQVHSVAKGHVEYANYSGWDIYRSQAQLAAMVAPQETSDSVRSMLNQYDQTGQLPKWALNNGESYVMVGDPADAIIADAYAFGARDFDTAHALRAMLTEANSPNDVRPASADYQKYGYIPFDGTYGCCNFYGSVSTQQEYNAADYSIASFAKALGNTSVANTFAARANTWQNVFNPATNYLEPKLKNGAFISGFSPTSSQGFVEGTSAQYTPMQPNDIAGLISASGGAKNWIAKLDALTADPKHPSAATADFGNEPSIEIPWEYDYAGVPWKTQKSVRDIQSAIFTNKPAGIAGNDDLGTMSAWYVFSALGFYPETPGTADAALGSPVFSDAAIHLPSGKTLTIHADNAATANPYVRSMTVNGASWAHAYLQPALFSDGGAIAVTLGATPNKTWAAAAGDAPPSDRTGLASALGFSTTPVVVTAPGTAATVQLGARDLSGAKQSVHWTATTASDGVTAGPSSGTLLLPKGGDRSQSVSITAPSAEGRYVQTFAFTDGTGAGMPSVTVEIDVAKPGSLWPYYNNAGVAHDGQPSSASFDGEGWSYSAEALAAVGVTPGAALTSNGLSYTWPDVTPGGLDNIEAAGQRIALTAPAAATRFGILGSSTNGPSEGDFVITYTDGTTQTLHFGFSDWTLNAGSSQPLAGTMTAVSTPYRDTTSGGRDTVNAFLFTTDAALTAGKTVQSVTMPASVTAGPLHVFAFGFAN